MRLMLAILSEDEMQEAAAALTERGYPGGTQSLAAQARDWIAGRTWADLAPEDVKDMSDAQALSGIARRYEGGMDAFITSCGYPAGSRF
jgi:hypothetical protein